MKRIVMVLVLIMAFTLPVMAQDLPGRFVGFGGGFGDKGFGWGALGIPLSEKLISYTLWDFTPTDSVEDSSFTLADGRVMLKMSATTGAAYKVMQLAPKFSLWGMGAAGLATTGEFNSAAFKYGGFVDYRVKDRFGINVGVGGQWDSLNKSSLDLRTGVNFYIGD
jgi:hypothetical protein